MFGKMDGSSRAEAQRTQRGRKKQFFSAPSASLRLQGACGRPNRFARLAHIHDIRQKVFQRPSKVNQPDESALRPSLASTTNDLDILKANLSHASANPTDVLSRGARRDAYGFFSASTMFLADFHAPTSRFEPEAETLFLC